MRFQLVQSLKVAPNSTLDDYEDSDLVYELDLDDKCEGQIASVYISDLKRHLKDPEVDINPDTKAQLERDIKWAEFNGQDHLDYYCD